MRGKKIDPAHQLGRSRADCREDYVCDTRIAQNCQASLAAISSQCPASIILAGALPQNKCC